ncbi:MAG: prepilin-type N-terminal cleavage/methylation domain-containing protein [Nitrospirae bacterium]|nr:prepilin-type N-terminal cleavage/methylation domain-containing protein [Nitrospirota bacterium]
MRTLSREKTSWGSAGFTLAELLVSLFVVSLMMGAIFSSFTTLTRSFKIETKNTEEQIESVLSLDLLRYDLESAGFGLPEGNAGGACGASNATLSAAYNEAVATTPTGSTNYTPNQYSTTPNNFNDSTNSCEPRPLVLEHNNNPTPSNTNGSDVLVIKSITADRTAVTKKWTMLDSTGHYIVWNDTKWDMIATDRAIAVNSTRKLISGGFQFNTLPATPAAGQFYVLYGINATTTPRMPFNRVDYYIQRACSPQLGNCTGTNPQHPYPLQCHPSGYTLYRSIISHVNGTRTEQPIMDCVLDFQVALGIDTGCTDTVGNGCTGTLTWCRFTNGNTCNNSSDTGCAGDPCAATTTYLNNAQNIRQYLKQVKVFVLVHEGKIDPNFTYANTSIAIGDNDITLKNYNLSTLSNYANYRWKLLKINVKLNSLGGNYE